MKKQIDTQKDNISKVLFAHYTPKELEQSLPDCHCEELEAENRRLAALVKEIEKLYLPNIGQPLMHQIMKIIKPSPKQRERQVSDGN